MHRSVLVDSLKWKAVTNVAIFHCYKKKNQIEKKY